MAHPLFQRTGDVLQAGDILVVVHDFDARSSDELTLRKSDRVELVELDDGFGDGWYLGRHLTRGITGLFPGVYTAKLPASLAAVPPSSPTSRPQQTPQPLRPAQSGHSAEMKSIVQTPISSHDVPGPYQHSNESSAAEPGGQTAFTHAQSYEQLRNSIPAVHSTYIPGVQRSIGQALGETHNDQDSPVMNETLSVIDEHITDLSTPRQSLAPLEHSHDGSESEYSSQMERASFVAGPETDEEENGGPSLAEVSRWDHKQTADHLRSLGVDSKHCDIFEDQEITGDVLLEMDQSFIYMKEYDFGVMGRRLKTWHKIRDFQNQVRGSEPSRKSSLKHNGSTEDFGRIQSRTLSGATILPRIPSLMEEPGLSIRQSQYAHQASNGAAMPPPLHTQQSGAAHSRTSFSAASPPSSWRASVAPDSPGRPSAALVREMSHTRRHSSIDVGKQPSQKLSSSSLVSATTPHRKQPSLDRDWFMGNATPTSTHATTPSLRLNTIKKQESLDFSPQSPLVTEGPNLDLDRGYFSGNEVDNRKSRNVLHKRESLGTPAHSRQSSMQDEAQKKASATKRHSRIASVDSSRETGPPTSPAAKAYHSKYYKGRFRSASARGPLPRAPPGGMSPSVTNLEIEATAPKANVPGSGSTASTHSRITMPDRARKLMGFRTTSEGVTGGEKEVAKSPTILGIVQQESPAESPDGSRTPSATSRSLEIDNTDNSSKNTDHMSSMLSTKTPIRPRPKTKQQTSAYTKGLLKLSPEAAQKNCDYHGWMKKKSSSLITTWKPRLFILRGKRLSYYYSEKDTEERGVIDISSHKVLVANSDPMTTLHAQLTGAASVPSPGSAGSSADTSPVIARTPNTSAMAPFYFKLVPPKAGMSRAVQFTKPTVHYFQVDNIAEGRKWMGEIMKATIEHDLTSFETTNKQKTISLAKARARKERPPALKGTENVADVIDVADVSEIPVDTKTGRESGLNIQGLNFDAPNAASPAGRIDAAVATKEESEVSGKVS